MVKPLIGFKASDGRVFADEADAERHERLIEAERAYNDAMRTYAKLLWETQKTADGQQFELTSMQSYWYVQYYADRRTAPGLVSVSFDRWQCWLDDNDNLTVVVRDGERVTRYKISDLYVNKAFALAGLQEASLDFLQTVANRAGVEIVVRE